ncbi:MAG: CaiB/BaiF CoA transferase family protein [Rhizobiaceae bacterium]
MAGLGPVPLAGLLLAEMGAEVLRVERLGGGRDFLSLPKRYDLDRHGRSVVKLDLKRQEGVALLLEMASAADVLVEGYRPGVMERFGLGPEDVQAVNPALVYGRMTGFGQGGPMKDRAGHDITYLAHSGVLHAIGEKGGRPIPPLNLAADYGGGTMFLVMGVLAALFERSRSGKGQVVDAAMIDGAAMLAAPFFGFMASGFWQDRRGSNLLDTGAPFYDTYETADGGHVAVGCLEPQFFAEFARLLPLEERLASRQYDVALWAEMREAIATRIGEKSRDEWTAIFEGTDACVAPVLSLTEAPDHPHNQARGTFVETNGFARPAPAPRFSRSSTRARGLEEVDPVEALATFGIDRARSAEMLAAGIVDKG